MSRLLISIPKSGTHILMQIFGRYGHTTIPYGSMIYEQYPHELTVRDLGSTFDLGISHMSYHPTYEKMINERNIKTIFLYRDPRDLMVSYYFWIKELGHSGASTPGLIEDVTPILESDDPFDLMIDFWGHHIRRYVPWLYVDNVLKIRYEDFHLHTYGTFSVIKDFWEDGEYSVNQMMDRMRRNNTRTFRKGIIGDWRKHLSVKHQMKFMDKMGSVMEVFGYFGE